MMDGMLFTGKTVEDAVAEGLRSMGLSQDQVEVEVINRGSRGLFGIGSEPAQVRLAPRRDKGAAAPAQSSFPAAAPAATVTEPAAPAAPEQAVTTEQAEELLTSIEPLARQAPIESTEEDGEQDSGAAASMAQAPVSDEQMVALAVELLSETVQRMGFEADVVASWQEPDADNDEPYLLLNLQGRDLGALIGRRGDTLGNLQYLLRLMVNQRLHTWKNIVVDVEQYRQHRAEHLMQLALRSADQVAKTGRPLSLEPMPPNERRIIHLALRDHANVYTESSGEGERRKIQILPKRN